MASSTPAPAALSAPDRLVERMLPALKAVADGNRLRVLLALVEGERCVCELQEELAVGQSLLSHHLATLKEAGLVEDRRDGRWVHYRIRPEGFAALEVDFAKLAAASADPHPGRRGCGP